MLTQGILGVKSMDNKNETTAKVKSSYAAELIEKINSGVVYKSYPKGYRILLSSRQPDHIYLIRAGVISIHRQPDDILLGILSAPTLRGMTNAHLANLGKDSEYTLKAIEDVELAVVERNAFYALLSNLQLWETYAKHLELNISVMGEHIFKLLSPTVYDVVRVQLPELMAEPESVRKSVTVEEYIRSKTRLSRSRVMQILASLRSAGYIKTDRGFLVWVKDLPETY
jgi:CRP-like cAMP-binding protein